MIGRNRNKSRDIFQPITVDDAENKSSSNCVSKGPVYSERNRVRGGVRVDITAVAVI